MDVPDFVKEKIQMLSKRTNTSVEELFEEYSKIYNDPFVQSDPQFKSENERHSYALRVLWVRISAQPPSKEFFAIAYGLSEPRITRSGIRQARVYLLVKRNDMWKKHTLLLRDKYIDLIDSITVCPPTAYRVWLAEVGDLLFATTKTKFENGKPVPGDLKNFFVKQVGVLPVKLSDASRRLSARDENGYVIETDLRAIQGIILRYNVGTRSDGTRFGVYTVSDDSLDEDLITEDGMVVPTQFTVWTPPSLVKYDVDSECFFVGQLVCGKDAVIFMNAINVIPIHVKLIGE